MTDEVATPKYDISREGRDFVKTFQYAETRVQRAERELQSARTDLTSARDALIKWCSPADAQPGEKFGIWCRDEYGNEILLEVCTEAPGGADEGFSMQPGTVKIRRRK